MAVTIDRALLKSFLVPCALSIFCELSVIGMFVAKKYYTNYAFLLIFYLILANLLLSAGFFMSVDRLPLNYQSPQADSPLCIIQTILINFGQLATALWTSIISYILMRSFQTSEVRTQHQLLVFMSLGFGVPLLMTIFPFALQLNGDSGYYCWLTLMGSGILTIFEFTVPTLCCIIYDLVAIVRAVIIMRQLKQKTEGVRRLLLYPIISFICWVMRFTARLEFVLTGSVSTWVSWSALLFIGMQGIISSFVYASNMQACRCSNSAQSNNEDESSKEMELVWMNSRRDEASKGSIENRARAASNPVNPVDIPRIRSYSHFDQK